MPEPELPPSQQSVPARKRGFQRVLSIIAIIVCCSFFACAGFCFLGLLIFGPKNVDTPAGANEVASHILDWTLPNSFAGKTGSTVDNSLFRLDVARFAHQEGRGDLVVGQLHNKWMPYPGQYSQLQDIMEKLVPNLKKLDLTEQVTKNRIIRGVPATFQVGRGEDRASTTRYRQVIGHFRGKLNDAVLILEVEAEFMTDEEIETFLDSIK